jgi:hypothetical protein
MTPAPERRRALAAGVSLVLAVTVIAGCSGDRSGTNTGPVPVNGRPCTSHDPSGAESAVGAVRALVLWASQGSGRACGTLADGWHLSPAVLARISDAVGGHAIAELTFRPNLEYVEAGSVLIYDDQRFVLAVNVVQVDGRWFAVAGSNSSAPGPDREPSGTERPGGESS